MDKHFEYRSGNLVMVKGKIEKILSTTPDWPFLDTLEYGACVIGWKDIEPVPISGWRLADCGFEQTQGHWWAIKFFTTEDADPVQYLAINTFSKRACIYDEDTKNPLFVGQLIADMHKLQNLFYELTGQELNIKNMATIYLTNQNTIHNEK